MPTFKQVSATFMIVWAMMILSALVFRWAVFEYLAPLVVICFLIYLAIWTVLLFSKFKESNEEDETCESKTKTTATKE